MKIVKIYKDGPLGEEELRVSVSEFVADLSKKTGVDIDPEEVWAELMAREVHE